MHAKNNLKADFHHPGTLVPYTCVSMPYQKSTMVKNTGSGISRATCVTLSKAFHLIVLVSSFVKWSDCGTHLSMCRGTASRQ